MLRNDKFRYVSEFMAFGQISERSRNTCRNLGEDIVKYREKGYRTWLCIKEASNTV